MDDFDETRCPIREAHESSYGGQPPANRELLTVVVCPIALEPLNLINKHANELGIGPYCSQAFRLDHRQG